MTLVPSAKPGKAKLTCFREVDVGDELSNGTDAVKVRRPGKEGEEGVVIGKGARRAPQVPPAMLCFFT